MGKEGDAEPLRDIVVRRLAELELRAIPAARAAGLERSFIRDIILRKKRDIRGPNLIKLAAALRLDPEKLAVGIAQPLDAEPGPPDLRGDDVPVWGTAAGALADSFTIEAAMLRSVRRPPGLLGERGIYAVFVKRRSMEPEHRAGHLRFVSEQRTPAPGDSVVIRTRHRPDEPEVAYLAHLVSEDSKKVVARKLAPAAKVEFDRKFVTAIHKVLTVNELFGV